MEIAQLKDFLLAKGFNLLAAIPVQKIQQELQRELLKINPTLADKSLMLIGSGGKLLWNKLPKEKTDQKRKEDILDNYTTQTILEIKENFPLSIEATLYPNYKIHYPLQRISREILHTKASACGLDISSDFGLWFGLRSLLVIGSEIEIAHKSGIEWTSPCLACQDKPCLKPKVKLQDIRLTCPFKTQEQYDKAQLEHHAYYLELTQAMLKT